MNVNLIFIVNCPFFDLNIICNYIQIIVLFDLLLTPYSDFAILMMSSGIVTE
jgi:hypothetical protein